MAFIEVESISFKYRKGKNVFSDFSLSFNNNTTTGIVGENGSGKTTLSKLIMGILKPQSGSIRISNMNLADLALSDVGREVGYLFQNPERQLFAMTVEEEMSFPFKLQGKLDDEIEARIEDTLTSVDLLDKKTSLVHHLSYGEKQRLALASILVLNPKFIILDEPTTGLDNVRKAMLSTYIRKIQLLGVGIIIISHDKDFINEHSNRVIRLAGGRVIDDSYKERNRC